MYEGSMFGAGLNVFAVWNWIIANADAKGFVEINAKLLAAMLGGSVEDVQSAINYLSEPDLSSRNPADEGRRIVRESQFMYRIVSYGQYRNIRDMETKREYDRNYRRSERARKMSSDEPTTLHESSDESMKSPQAEVEEEANRKNTLVDSSESTRGCESSQRDLKNQLVVDTWNRITEGKPLPRARLTTKRRREIAVRLREPGWFEEFEKACEYVAREKFYQGQGDRKWVATLDHLLKPGKATELSEKETVRPVQVVVHRHGWRG
jgi:hypothetical protein